MSDIERKRDSGTVEPMTDETFDEWARDKGRELRRPAPLDGLRDVHQRRRTQLRTRAAIASGACAIVIVGVIGVIAANRNNDRSPVSGPSPTTTASTGAASAPASATATSVVMSASQSTASSTAAAALPSTTTATPLPAAQPLDAVRTKTIAAQGGANALVAADGVVGVVKLDTGQLALYDAADGTIRQTVANVKGEPIVAGFGSIWIPNAPQNLVTRVDPRSGDIQATIPIAAKLRDQSGSAVNGRGAWLVSGYPSRLLRIDPATNAVEEIPAPDNAFGVGATDEALWVSTSNGNLYRLDPIDGHQVASIALGGEPLYVYAYESDVWVLGRTTDFRSVVHHIDAVTNRLRASIIVDDHFEIADLFNGEFAGGFLWVTPPSSVVVKIDPRTDTVVARYRDTPGGGDVTIVGNTIWVTNDAADTISIIPLH